MPYIKVVKSHHLHSHDDQEHDGRIAFNTRRGYKSGATLPPALITVTVKYINKGTKARNKYISTIRCNKSWKEKMFNQIRAKYCVAPIGPGWSVLSPFDCFHVHPRIECPERCMIALVELVPNLCFSYYIVTLTIVICLCIIRLSALLNVFSHWLHLLVISRHNAVSTIVVDCCPKGFLRENGSALMDPLRHWGPFTFLSFIQIFICQLSPFLQLSDVFCNVFSKFTHTDHGDYEDQLMN